MKKNYFKMVSLVFVFSLLTTTLFAQGPYVGVNVGYGFNMGSQNINGINDYIKKMIGVRMIRLMYHSEKD